MKASPTLVSSGTLTSESGGTLAPAASAGIAASALTSGG
jgi:hypothetical protein